MAGFSMEDIDVTTFLLGDPSNCAKILSSSTPPSMDLPTAKARSVVSSLFGDSRKVKPWSGPLLPPRVSPQMTLGACPVVDRRCGSSRRSQGSWRLEVDDEFQNLNSDPVFTSMVGRVGLDNGQLDGGVLGPTRFGPNALGRLLSRRGRLPDCFRSQKSSQSRSLPTTLSSPLGGGTRLTYADVVRGVVMDGRGGHAGRGFNGAGNQYTNPGGFDHGGAGRGVDTGFGGGGRGSGDGFGNGSQGGFMQGYGNGGQFPGGYQGDLHGVGGQFHGGFQGFGSAPLQGMGFQQQGDHRSPVTGNIVPFHGGPGWNSQHGGNFGGAGGYGGNNPNSEGYRSNHNNMLPGSQQGGFNQAATQFNPGHNGQNFFQDRGGNRMRGRGRGSRGNYLFPVAVVFKLLVLVMGRSLMKYQLLQPLM